MYDCHHDTFWGDQDAGHSDLQESSKFGVHPGAESTRRWFVAEPILHQEERKCWLHRDANQSGRRQSTGNEI